VLYFSNLSKYPGIRHFVTDRGFGEVMLNNGQKKLAKELGIETKQVVFIKQIHKNTVVEAKVGIPKKADAVVTHKQGLLIVVRVADCVPVLLFDPKKRIIAAVHAGWKGSVAGIVAKTVRYMEKTGSNPADLVAGIGPSIGPCCFKVKEDVASQFEAKYVVDGYVDLWKANYEQLMESGVNKANIEVSGVCTHCNLDKYFSYRATGEVSSFASGIMLAV